MSAPVYECKAELSNDVTGVECNEREKKQKKYILEKESSSCIGMFFGHFFFMILIFSLFFSTVFYMTRNHVGPFTSSPERIDFSNSAPFYMVQVSDLHISGLFPNKARKIEQVFENISRFIHPSIFVATGDIADGTSSEDGLFQIRRQVENNWITYNESLHRSGLYEAVNRNGDGESRIVEVLGNHDIFNILDGRSDQSVYKKYLNNNRNLQHNLTLRSDNSKLSTSSSSSFLNVDNFYYQNENLNFIMMHPAKYPFLPAPIGSLVYLDISIIKEMDEKFMDNATNVIVSHFPFFTLWTSDKYKEEMRRVYSKADFMLSGHTHPRTNKFFHFGSLMTVVSAATGFASRFGLISIEGINYNSKRNNHFSSKDEIINETVNNKGKAFVYHCFDFSVGCFPYVFVTFPVPLNQTSDSQVFDFDENNFPVRVLSFDNESKTTSPVLFVFIDDNLMGKMELIDEIDDTVSFLQLNIVNKNIQKNQSHSLKIVYETGNLSQVKAEETFFIGKKSPILDESTAQRISPNFFFRLTPFLAFLIIIRLIPLWKLFNNEILDNYEEYMFQGKYKEKFPFYKAMFIGPLYIICRLRKLPPNSSLRNLLWFLFVWYIPLPLFFTKIENTEIVSLWFWGFFYNNQIRLINETLCFLSLYYIMFLIPLIDLIGIFYENRNDKIESKRIITQKIEVILFTFVIMFGGFAWVSVMIMCGGLFSLLTAPLTYFTVLSMLFSIYQFVKDRNRIAVNQQKKLN